MATMYLTCFLFVVLVLGGISRLSGFSLWKFLKYIKDEIFTVLGTSSSESVVPQLMRKLEHAGISKPVVGLVVPSGLTFNPDGQCIYYTMASLLQNPRAGTAAPRHSPPGSDFCCEGGFLG